MKRTPEPEELMDEADQARAYAEADFSAANELFLELFAEAHPKDFQGRILDLGCGPADIPLRLARRYPQARIDAVDGAPAMLELAQQAITTEGLDKQINLHCHYLPSPEPAREYQAVVSNSLLHHLNDPLDLWRSIDGCILPGGQVLVMDLLRPETPEQALDLVKEYAADAPEVLRRDFHASLHAAYTLEEVTEQLQTSGLGFLEATRVSDRHLAVRGRMP
ncbi:class I SAM-dependent methyltransferase [Thiolapillus brandeum]|uniref:Methyltransferase domain-containing protein n=1 Tax=Thiolapillus brandeum TaxID=1076588 RepID=A0A7U6GGM5_9GAMM|nr:class I SAM-dependent methyltransferase [Thiolapillus brandeum]BAO43307.1 conserved hypothetical protein [Thiolapillus brandeum]